MTKSLLITPAVLISMKARTEEPKKESPEEIRQLIRETLCENYCLNAGPDQDPAFMCRSNEDRMVAEAPWDWCEKCLRYWVKKIIQDGTQEQR